MVTTVGSCEPKNVLTSVFYLNLTKIKILMLVEVSSEREDVRELIGIGEVEPYS